MTKPGQSWPPTDTEPAVPHEDAPAPGSKLGVHYSHCFGCGDEVEAGLHIQSSVAEGPVVVSQFTVTEAHQGAPGLAHGGLLACAFDEALGSAVGNLLRKPSVTAKLETDFVRPVPVGSTLHIAAELDGVSGRKIYVSADGRLDAADGPVAVRARALFVTVGFEHFTTHGDKDALHKFGVSDKERPKDWDINP
ncbi:PaaI family thioesterase [Prauserella cavernicola]|uniref:Acyl-coenzyme A thioesterase THEM4 n=1 Tax=Prauserella cavernicola TaxID=2800127 RepID=A0A934V5S1_9PSEU|nr:PaaI family thioesterase [Prauserella cavernicola]MBK1784918.1 PaaI family thioesterase [Prauserella cavernicola]